MAAETGDHTGLEIDDADIALLLWDQDERGIELLLKKYAGRVRGALINRYAGTLQDNEIDQAVNQAAMNIWANSHNFDDKKGALGGYFHKAAIRCAIDIIRREQIQGSRFVPYDPFLMPEPSPERAKSGISAKRQNQLKAMAEIIDALPPKQEHIMRADAAAGGKADSQRLAQELQSPVGSIYALRSTARKRVVEEMEKRELL